jgi:hypothetical protein
MNILQMRNILWGSFVSCDPTNLAGYCDKSQSNPKYSLTNLWPFIDRLVAQFNPWSIRFNTPKSHASQADIPATSSYLLIHMTMVYLMIMMCLVMMRFLLLSLNEGLNRIIHLVVHVLTA